MQTAAYRKDIVYGNGNVKYRRGPEIMDKSEDRDRFAYVRIGITEINVFRKYIDILWVRRVGCSALVLNRRMVAVAAGARDRRR